jgi:hypothetical protein
MKRTRFRLIMIKKKPFGTTKSIFWKETVRTKRNNIRRASISSKLTWRQLRPKPTMIK